MGVGYVGEHILDILSAQRMMHHHVICSACGKTVDVGCTPAEMHRTTAAADSGYHIDQIEVIYWGTGPECLAQASRE